MRNHSTNRFAAFDGDKLVALVAEGEPDVSALSDPELGEREAELIALVSGFGADTPAAEIDAVREEIVALRAEAERRMSATPAEDPAPADPTPAADPAPAGDAAEALARLQETLSATPPAADDDPAPVAPALSTEGLSEALSAGVAAAVTPLAESMREGLTELAARIPAAVERRGTARELSAYHTPSGEPVPEEGGPVLNGGSLVAAADSGLPMGAEITEMGDLVRIMTNRLTAIGRSKGSVDDERVVVASYRPPTEIPAERDLRRFGGSAVDIHRAIRNVVGPDAPGIDPWTGRERPVGRGGMICANPDALVASGGLAAPVEPYYPQLVLSVSARPMLGAMPGFVAERGGIRGVFPPSIASMVAASTPGLYADGHSTSGSATFTSATASFAASDLGQPIVDAGSGVIPAGTTIAAVGSSTSITLSQNALATGTTDAFYLPGRNPNNLGNPVGVITAGEDALNQRKFTYDVPDGTPYEFDVYSVYTSLQFGNLTARTFPEQVEAAILVANAIAARTAEQTLLDTMTNWSTLLTGAKTFGTSRQLLAQYEHMASYYRNHNRMDDDAVLRLAVPAWSLNAMRGDFLSTFIGGGAAGWGLSDDELSSWFENAHILPTFYLDGPSDKSQLFAAPGSGAINTGANTATPVAIPDYPESGTAGEAQVVSFMWAEGVWLGLTTGELDLGVVRDSTLNSQNKFRNFEEVWETPAFVGGESLRCVHKVAADGTYGQAVAISAANGNGI